MKPPGTYKLTHKRRAAIETDFDPFGREGRIVDSLRAQILAGGPGQSLRLRQVFTTPREVFRLEIEEPEFHYYRTTLLDRDSLEDLLESEEVRERIVEGHDGAS
jgi:hypothetical protein